MSELMLIGLSGIIALGVSAQWLAWRMKLPAILILLIFGILAGPVTGWIDPDALFGDLLSPFVSMAVAIILFEGGLSLRFRDLRGVGGVVGKLITIGIIVTWVLSTVAAYMFLDLGLELSVLLGAVLIVTGPTVIIPLIRQVRPTETIGSVLKWEGIVNDPIGAMMAVLVFETILVGGFAQAAGTALISIVYTVIFGTFFGLLGAAILWIMLKRHLCPDFLINPISLMVVVSMFALSNLMQHESGLWAVTVMGIALANQKSVRLNHILEFKENLQVLLISALFIMLASRLTPEDIAYFNLQSFAFIGAMLLVVRPITVFVSTIGSKLTWKERSFLGWMAPRGIVAAAISAIFALRLEQEGYQEAELLVPYTFIVIICTVTIYGLSANPLAKFLGVAKPQPRGLLIIGAHKWARQIGELLLKLDFKVVVADSNRDNIDAAEAAGLGTYHGNVLSEYAVDHMDLDGLGKLIALTPNDEVNSLAAIRFTEAFGSAEVFQLSPYSNSRKLDKDATESVEGRILFEDGLSFNSFSDYIASGCKIEPIELSDEFDYKDFKKKYDENAIPLFAVSSDKFVVPFSVDNPPSPQKGDTIITLILKDSPESVPE